MIAKKENFDEKENSNGLEAGSEVIETSIDDNTDIREQQNKEATIDAMSLDAAAEIVDATMEEIEPTTADEFNEEYLKEEVSEIEKELEKNLNTLGRTVQQLMEKMDDMNQNTINLKHRIQVLETRVGVIH